MREWILTQKDNSIDLLKIFKYSLSLNHNAFDALITIHQLLRNEARFKNKEYYTYQSTEEAANLFWSKFVDIRGDLNESNPQNEGDHRGSWYRIWGMMLYRLNLDQPEKIVIEPKTCNCTIKKFTNSTLRNFKSSAVAISAELYKYLMDAVGTKYKAGGDRPGKSRINTAGSQIAGNIIDHIDDDHLPNSAGPECSSDKYLINALY